MTSIWETRHARLSADDPLKDPKSLEDLMSILRRDQLDLFPAGVAFAAKQDDVRALAIRAQIELSWAEALHILSETVSIVSRTLRKSIHALEMKEALGTLSEKDKGRLVEVRTYLKEMGDMMSALNRLASEHLRSGAILARDVIDKEPNEYYGYRVAVDYFRMRKDWPHFDQMMKKLEETNPQSNGLLFARGLEAATRFDDPAKAVKLLHEALARDPQFVRAQAHILLLQEKGPAIWGEYRKLKAMNPHHQIVTWAGDYIERMHESYVEEHERERERIEQRATPQ